MQIQVHTDHHTEGGEKFTAYVSGMVETALSHVSARISRVEVHLSDENGSKKGQDDKRCMMEARVEGHQPIAVTQKAGSVDEALNGAADKLLKALESTLNRIKDTH
jgi:ribosome-associated translation inhibitor RaiA